MTDLQAMPEEASLHAGPAGPSRKRRKRAPATGASEDCSTCRKAQTLCDRVRPFCGPCIEKGRECSGYRTVLTWGVGVASRGKLRGLTTPIATSSNVKGAESTAHTKSEHVNSDPSPPQGAMPKSGQRDLAPKRKRSNLKIKPDIEPLKPPHVPTLAAPTVRSKWQQEHLSRHVPGTAAVERHKSFTSHPYAERSQDIVVDALSSTLNGSLPTPSLSSASGTSYANSVWDRVSEASGGSDSPNFNDPFDENRIPSLHHNGRSNVSTLSPSVANQYPGVPSPVTSDWNLWSNGAYAAQSIPIAADMDPEICSPREENPVWRISLSPRSSQSYDGTYDDLYGGSEDDGRDRDSTLQAVVPFIQRSPFDVKHFHLPRRMQGLLDYYDRMICPVLVAFDDNSNPYRHHILHLAMQNPGLQNAIAALVTNNMRMRDFKQVPLLKYDIDTNKVAGSSGPTQEELLHKRMSILQLNNQLADVNTASDDSVLATLLILCLFHVCNTGFSKFKTQLAGVQKVLRMRNIENRSDFVGWVEMFFAWFDVMTSAVNDRETEILGDSLDMMDWTANLGAMERFSGCDGRLFKLIARLGRLNLLSQGRPVRPEPIPETQRFSSVEEHSHLPPPDADRPGDDDREEFWGEWHAIRARLKSWRFIPTAHPNSPQASLTQRSLEDISEAFRYAALLYTERLAYPSLPSSAPALQCLVRAVLNRIEALGVQSCVTKFMLWPLFVAGTECIDPKDRQLIRDRCVEIQEESGFYNNLSGLHLLERMWAAHDGDPVSDVDAEAEGEGKGDGKAKDVWGQPRRDAFHWRKVMERTDGEYIVI